MVERQLLSGGALLALLVAPPDTYPAVAPLILIVAATTRLWPGDAPERIPSSWPLFAAFLLYAGVSLAWTPMPSAGLDALTRWLVAMAAFVLAATVGRGGALAVALAAALFHAGYAVWQRLVVLPELASLDDAMGPVAALVRERAADGRAFSTIALPGHLGALLAALTPVLMAGCVPGAAIRRRALCALGLVGALVGLYASAALAASGALGVVVALYFLRRGVQHPRARLLALGALLVLGAVVAPRLSALGSSGTDNPALARWRSLGRANLVVAEAPFAGHGIGSYPAIWVRHAQPGDVPARNAHMSYLEVAAETGLPSLAVLVGLLALLLCGGGWSPAVAGATVLLIHAAMDFDFQTYVLLGELAMLLGLVGVGAEGQTLGRRGRAALVAAFLLGVLLWVLGGRGLGASAWTRHGDGRALGEQALAELDRGDPARALELILRARAIEPRTAWLAAVEGDVRLSRGEIFGAVVAYEEAHRLFPAKAIYGERRDTLRGQIRAQLGPHPREAATP